MSLNHVADCPALVCTPENTVADAVKLLVERDFSAAMVMEGEKIVGIFTERDVLTKVIDKGLDPYTTKVREIMSTHVESIFHKAELEDALSIMCRFKFRHLPLTDEEGKVVGIMSIRRVYDQYVKNLLNEMNGMAAYMGADGQGGD